MSNSDGVFNQKYEREGLASQRRYPNEAMIQFLAGHFFSIPKSERKGIRILELQDPLGQQSALVENFVLWARAGLDFHGRRQSGPPNGDPGEQQAIPDSKKSVHGLPVWKFSVRVWNIDRRQFG